MSDDIFERVSKLVEQFQAQNNKQASVEKKAEEDWSEYDVGKTVKLKDFPLAKEMEEVLGESMPSNPTVSEVDEGSEQETVEEGHENAPNPEVATEEGPDVPVDKPVGGTEAMKDAAALSDRELLGKLANVTYRILYEYAMIEPSKQIIKSGAFGKEATAAYMVADIIKQAAYDADLLAGCLLGIKQAAEENLEDVTAPAEDPAQVLAEASPEEIQEVLEENPDLAAAIAAQGAEVSPEAVLAEASPEEIQKVLEENPDLAAAIAAQGAEVSPEAVLAEASPEEIQKVLEENPDLAAEVAGGAVAEDPVQVLADASPEEIQEVLEENPDLAVALAGGVAEEDPIQVLADAAPEEIQEVLDENPDLAAALSQTMGAADLGTEEHKEEQPEEKKEEEEVKESSILAKLAALSDILEEQNITPEEVEIYLKGSSKEKEGVKVANAVRNFRNKFKGKVIKEADSPALKEHMRKFLQELLIG